MVDENSSHMAASSTKEVPIAFLFVFGFSTQLKKRDLAFENKPLERSHRQLSTSLGLLFHPESNEFIFFSFVSNMILGSLKVKTLARII